MEMDIREQEGIVVIAPVGDIAEENSIIFKEKLRELLKSGKGKIVLNIGKVEYITSAGLGIIAFLVEMARGQGGDIVLVNPNESIMGLFQITDLHKVFTISDTEDEAVEVLRNLPTDNGSSFF